jgi:hypothetical protein
VSGNIPITVSVGINSAGVINVIENTYSYSGKCISTRACVAGGTLSITR